jgi:hypothetical protein
MLARWEYVNAVKVVAMDSRCHGDFCAIHACHVRKEKEADTVIKYEVN